MIRSRHKYIEFFNTMSTEYLIVSKDSWHINDQAKSVKLHRLLPMWQPSTYFVHDIVATS